NSLDDTVIAATCPGSGAAFQDAVRPARRVISRPEKCLIKAAQAASVPHSAHISKIMRRSLPRILGRLDCCGALLERIPFERNISCVGEITGTFLGREAGDYVAEGIP